MDKDKCIREMYIILQETRKCIQKNDLSIFRRNRTGGQDQYAGMSGFERALCSLEEKFEEEIWDANKAAE